jgi:PTS system galactitol-specific IIB component
MPRPGKVDYASPMKKILVACGTAIATSTVVAKKLEEKLRARGMEVKIDQCKASEVGSRAAQYDLIVSTTEVDDTRGKPHIRTLSFLTGIGIEGDIEKIAKLLGA